MSWMPPPTAQRRYREWPIASDGDWEYIGTSEDGKPVFYDENTGHVYRGTVDEEAEQLVPAEEPSWEINPQETLGQTLEQIGQEIGWESLSEFAQDHREDENEDEDSS